MLGNRASPALRESAVALAPLFGTSGKANREWRQRFRFSRGGAAGGGRGFWTAGASEARPRCLERAGFFGGVRARESAVAAALCRRSPYIRAGAEFTPFSLPCCQIHLSVQRENQFAASAVPAVAAAGQGFP